LIQYIIIKPLRRLTPSPASRSGKGEKESQMYLDNNQIEFLKKLSKVGTMERSDIDDSQISMILYLKKQGLISVDRDFSGSHILNYNQKIDDIGEIMSIWISEQGKAYLAEVLHEDEFAKSIEKIAKSAEIQSDIALKTSKN
jgi:hypothetical protein